MMHRPIARLGPTDPFPDPESAWADDTPYPGLLAVGGKVTADRLANAYARGIFPWYSPGEPPLWWSTDPRLVLRPEDLKVSRSLRRRVRQILGDGRYSLHMDRDFRGTMVDCAAPRRDGPGSWIGPEIIAAYTDLHRRGLAHSIELYEDAERVAGLYVVSLGRMVFGESMFARVNDGSKVCLLALCGLCQRVGVPAIDCQQETTHLQSLGAQPWPRGAFLRVLREAVDKPGPRPTEWYAGTWAPFLADVAPWGISAP